MSSRPSQSGPCRCSPQARTRFGRHIDWTALTRSGRLPVTTTSVIPLSEKSIAARRWPNAVGCSEAMDPKRLIVFSAASRYFVSPVNAPRRRSPNAARLFAEGTALSMISFGREINAGASVPVVKNPPFSSSENFSIKTSAVLIAASSHFVLPVTSLSFTNASVIAA